MSAIVNADVVIIGGGLVGASAAFHLRRFQGMSVILLERGYIGSQASGVNFGNVRRQGRYLPQLPLAHRARDIWGALPELLGEDCEFVPTGHLKVAYTGEEMHELEVYAHDARAYGLELTIMSGAESRRLHSYIGADVVGGSYAPVDGHANPRLAAPAFARAARREGAFVYEQSAVLKVEWDAGGFRIEAADGRVFHAGVLINAAGAWGARIACQFGEEVPLTPRGPHMAVTETLPYFIKPVLGTSDHKIYMRQVLRGSIVFGGGAHVPVDLDSPFPRPKTSQLLRQWADMTRLIPALRKIQVLRTWSGVEGYLPDGLPVIGPSGKIPGLIHAFGLCGHGFQIAPAVGAVIAEIAHHGESRTPIDYSTVERFHSAAGRNLTQDAFVSSVLS